MADDTADALANVSVDASNDPVAASCETAGTTTDGAATWVLGPRPPPPPTTTAGAPPELTTTPVLAAPALNATFPAPPMRCPRVITTFCLPVTRLQVTPRPSILAQRASLLGVLHERSWLTISLANPLPGATALPYG